MGNSKPPANPGGSKLAFAAATCLNLASSRRQALRETSESLIAKTGVDRISTVKFHGWTGADDCRAAVAELYGSSPEPAAVAAQDQLLADIARRGDDVVLIIAHCKVRE